jgi:uncharacterized LabA/DUF88 family protein
MKRTVILIDGQNLFYTLKSLGLKEHDLNWNKLFKSFLETDDELIRTYWFRPQKLFDGSYSSASIRNQIAHNLFKDCYPNFRNGNLSAIDTETLQKIETEAKNAESWLNKQRARFSRLEFKYDQLSLDNTHIEIVKKGIVKVNPYKQEYYGEKGVDIALAVKMLSLSAETKCDKIILISGDYDYADAISYVKNKLTIVYIVKFHKGSTPNNHYMSRDLSILADKIINVFEADIRNNYLKPN